MHFIELEKFRICDIENLVENNINQSRNRVGIWLDTENNNYLVCNWSRRSTDTNFAPKYTEKPGKQSDWRFLAYRFNEAIDVLGTPKPNVSKSGFVIFVGWPIDQFGFRRDSKLGAPMRIEEEKREKNSVHSMRCDGLESNIGFGVVHVRYMCAYTFN